MRLVTRPPSDIIAALTTYMQENDAVCRAALGRVTTTRYDAAALAILLTDSEPCVRWESARRLGMIGFAASAAVPSLRTALSDGSPSVARAALHALALIRPSSDPASASVPFSSIWSAFTGQLAAGRVEAALPFMMPSRREEYRALFTSLGDGLGPTARRLNAPLRLRERVGNGLVILEGDVVVSDVPQRVEVRFARDVDGAWRVESF
jgi:hypothetical protein